MSDGYNDTFSAEDEALLRQHEQDSTVPPAEDDDANPVTPEQVAAEQGQPAPAAEPAAPAGEQPQQAQPAGEQQAPEDERFRAFLEQHKDKSPEQLLQLAFQQQARANQAGFQARQSREQLDGLRERARLTIEKQQQRRQQIAQEREQFGQRLQDDPDAATRDLHERLMSREERETWEAERQARMDEAVGLASTAIPNFGERAADTMSFGREMNYSDEELANITDGRDLVTLYLASITGRMIKAGVMDIHGNLAAMPAPVQDTHPALKQSVPPVQTLGSMPARTSGGGQTLDQQLTDITNMSDADFDKLLRENPQLVEDLLRKAG